MKKAFKMCLGMFLLIFSFSVMAAPLQIVAAENFYGDIAKQIGGPYVEVTNIMSNPNQDPHLFSSSPATAEALVKADVVVYSGIGYDPWMNKLLAANQKQPKVVIVVADLVHKKMGDNPHIWYSPETISTYAAALTKLLAQLDPAHKDYFNQQHLKFTQSLQPINQLIKHIRAAYQNTPVIATEPVFGYMSDTLGLKMHDHAFQLSVMNNTEPSAAATRDFEESLKKHRIKVLIYNNQVVDPLTERMKELALAQNIPVVGVSETQPLNTTYQAWMTQELVKLQDSLSQK